MVPSLGMTDWFCQLSIPESNGAAAYGGQESLRDGLGGELDGEKAVE